MTSRRTPSRGRGAAAPRSRAPAPIPPILTLHQQRLVALQRQAGNRAVADLVAIQRVGGTLRTFAGMSGQAGLGSVAQPNPREYLQGGGTQALGDLGDLGGEAAGNVSD